ncbi:biotin synthase [Natranaerovirga hydrolytica]|uniref:Biotin synthase n=1 Tax=Natranaerovirga hydrolytica TaxID=680378 RepID=A0A4R1MKV2_9FIRM|nr:biotin synthase BioB [Natranaerovirga hydrolytica]TCK93478.1 biotin synthase [Natranaerovirga hydrolytica]
MKGNVSLKQLAIKVLEGYEIQYEEAIALSMIEDIDALLGWANTIREKYNGKKVDLCSIMNAKSGKCTEDCKFCAQSAHYKTDAPVFSLINEDEILKRAKENEANGVHRFSLVTSGKRIRDKDLDQILNTYKTLKEKTRLELCASFGLLTYQQALKIKKAGILTYHHNLETSKNYFQKICTTHTYEDRINTIKNALKAGLDVCCGGIFGIGELMEDRIQMVFEIKKLGIQSIPINILMPINGTPLEKQPPLDTMEILKTIGIIRFIMPSGVIRYGGGRKILQEHQKTGWHSGVNGALVGNYLTTIGNTIAEDIKMIKEQGLEV